MECDIIELLNSWKNLNGNVNSTASILEWINQLNKSTFVNVKECAIDKSTFWFYDDYNGEVLNQKRSFFSIKGMREFSEDKFVKEQPIIVQPEIGYLGIIGKKINGIWNFLMQAKVEPGNVNCVQISPTIQATKSNFTRAHGGKLPFYFDYFENSQRYHIIYDQIQSEQAARFLKKRNRNIIIIIDEDIEVYPNFRWMTLGQIKELMKIDNIVNMDTRTVLSGIPLISYYITVEQRIELSSFYDDKRLYKSTFETEIQNDISNIYHEINNFKMFKNIKLITVPLYELSNWKIDEYGITCNNKADFMVRYYDIEISGREVQKWQQPLFKSTGQGLFALIIKSSCDSLKFLVKIKPEIGSFDKVEVGPSIQWEPTKSEKDIDPVESYFYSKLQNKEGIVHDVIYSEEGGRFYHEQNRNIILEIPENDLSDLPAGYVWVSFAALNYLVQINNCLNIQLRNLISIIRI